MVHVVDSEDVMELAQLQHEIDQRVSIAEVRIISQIKVWFLTGLLGLFTTSIVGFASMMFVIGKLSERFDQQMQTVSTMEISRTNRGEWMDRKDALDDDLIRWAKTEGYVPPSWYQGKDADKTGK
jgi:hypothetical protein